MKRYNIIERSAGIGWMEAVEDKEGQFVEYTDVERLKAEIAALVSELDACLSLNRVTCAIPIVNKLRLLAARE